MDTFPKRALILDFDGLIADTEMSEYRAWKEIYEEHGTHLGMDDWRSAVGYVNGFDPRSHLEKLTGREFDWLTIDAQRRCRIQELNASLETLPGVRALIEQGVQLGYRLGVASNSTADWVGPGLQRLGLREFFGVVRTVDTVARPKPAPDVYLGVLADLGADSDGGYAFEDSEPGVRAAKAAGMYVIAVPNMLTQHQDLSLADEIRNTLEGYRLPPIHSRVPPAT